MSKDDKLTGLSVAVGEHLTLSPTTSSTPGSLAVTSSGSSSLDTPCSLSRVSSTEVSTPTNQPVVNYEAIDLSPGSLKSFDEVQAKIDEDGILEEKFELMSPLVLRLIYFLYGKEYAWKENPAERIKKIRKLVEDPEARGRLRCIACPTAGHLLMGMNGSFELYSRVAFIVENFFENKNAQGGFPRDPIIRFQQSSNCYVAASCVFATLQWQKDQPDDPEACKPLDVAQMGRRFSIESDEDLERRVLHDKGMCAGIFASKLVGLEWNFFDWGTHNFGWKGSVLLAAEAVANLVETGKYGLVTNFYVSLPFKEAAQKEAKEFMDAMKKRNNNTSTPSKKKADMKTDQLPFTYLKFDGHSIDTEGEVVSVPYDKKFDEKQKQLRQLWEKQLEDIKQKEKERGDKMKQNIPHQWWCKKPTSKSNDPTPGTDSSGTGSGMHAMVLLGTYKERKKDALTGKMRWHRYFMLLNSWHGLPLVLVSPEYLQACKALVHFPTNKLNKPTHELEREDRVLGETSFLDGGDEMDEYSSSLMDTNEFHGGEE